MDTLRTHHHGMQPERWRTLSLDEQLGNVGSEIGRARRWSAERPESVYEAISCALELLDLTIRDPRWHNHRLKELTRVRECIVDAYFGGAEYGTTWEDLDRYFFSYALAARKDR